MFVTPASGIQPDNRAMQKIELMIGYGPDCFPIGAVCYGCGAGMPRPEPALITQAEIIEWFSRAFAVHKEMKHGHDARVTPNQEDLLLN
jgi:hypothetical protein